VQQNWHAALPGAVADEAAALRGLYQLWGQPVPEREALNCATAMVGNLHCVRLSGVTAAALQRYDTPVALQLQRSTAAAPQFVVLKQLQQEHARVEFDRREWNVPWSELKALWQGDVLLLTPAPVGLLPLQLGATDPLVGWLDEQLYRHFHRNQPRWQREVYDRSTELVDSAPKQAWLVSHYLALREQAPATTFDAELLEQVKRFQQQQGLRSDGVVDIDTVLALTRSVAANQPRISVANAQRGG
jgi:murein L,D-transpeptidase YcbB/YkuD